MFMLALAVPAGTAQADSLDDEALEKTKGIVEDIVRSSFPEIKSHKIRYKSFASRENFFKSRFSVWRYATFQRMRHLIYVNPFAFRGELTENALRAVIAHELAHVSYYTRKNRLELLGLIRLTSGKSNREFERKADLEAIAKGFGEGLIEYRRWLYSNVSQEVKKSKQKIYFTPPEILLVKKALKEKPELLSKWRKDIPHDIESIRNQTRYE